MAICFNNAVGNDQTANFHVEDLKTAESAEGAEGAELIQGVEILTPYLRVLRALCG